jgi:hypothetical protein
MDVPAELRLMNYHCLFKAPGTRLDIPCCSYHANIFKWEYDPEFRNNSHTLKACNTFVQLLRTNRQISSEVTTFFYNTAAFHFCIDLYTGQDFDLYCTHERTERIGRSQDVVSGYLRPLICLSPGVKLIVFFADRDSPEQLRRLDTSLCHFPYKGYQQELGPWMGVDQCRPSLTEWLKVRAWCIQAFSFFHVELEDAPGDGNQRYEEVNEEVVSSTGKALQQLWDAHDQGSRCGFAAAKLVLQDAWERNYYLYGGLLQDLPDT